MQESVTVCKQCGWDRSQDGPPTHDPADQKARLGVAAGLVVAYIVMFNLISGTDAAAHPARAANPTHVAVDAQAYTPEPVSAQALSPATLSPTFAAAPAAATKPGALLTIKVADAKAAGIQAHDALQYQFDLPQTAQKCRLVGQIHGIGGFGGDLETFLLTDGEYVFWHANPAAIPHSSWETVRGSETTLDYQLQDEGTYHLVISNVMASTAKTVQVKAQVKCAR